MDFQTEILKWLLQHYTVTIENDEDYTKYGDSFYLEFYEYGKAIYIAISIYKDFEQAKREIRYKIDKEIFNIA